MDYYHLLELTSELGYRLAMSGAETFRIEDTIHRIMASYGIEAEIFAIPNNLLISIEGDNGKPMTRMRRIGFHGNDLNAVEEYNALSRRICSEKPDPVTALRWTKEVTASLKAYSPIFIVLGSLIGAAGYAVFFGGNWIDFLCAGICGALVGFVNIFLNKMKVNPFFSTMLLSVLLSVFAYTMGVFRLTPSADCVIIGTLMILLPGLIFTNAVRDIIYGDTNSGINRIIQVLLVAAAVALGTGIGWKVTGSLWGNPVSSPAIQYPLWAQCLAAIVGCVGFAILFNVHGKGTILCILGGGLAWAVYGISAKYGNSDIFGYFCAALFAAAYSEVMARIRKCPATAYLVIAIFPLIPGASIYYTANHFALGNAAAFASRGKHTIAIAGALAVGILIVSTIFRLITVYQHKKK